MGFSDKWRPLVTVLTVLAFLVEAGRSDDKPPRFDDTLRPDEKAAVKKLYLRVKDALTQEIQHEDKYLIRWVRARDFDLKEAEAMLRRNLAWRKQERMDEILSEDFTELKKRIPFDFKSFDRHGRPALVSGIGEMDVRKAVLAGRGAELDRYLSYGFERGVLNIHEVSNRTGKFFVTGHLLFNMGGYTARTHACIACVPTWLRLVQNYEFYYPQLATTIILINTPRVFQVMFSSLRPLMSAHTAKVFRPYGLDKQHFRRELLKIFDENELPIAFGGTRKKSA